MDPKAHSINDKHGKPNQIIPLNDAKSIETVADQYNGVGFVIAMCNMQFDLDRTFQKWHEHCKGGLSDYERERIGRGAPSRIRKKSCDMQHWWVLFFSSAADFRRGLAEGWASLFQRNWKNKDGSLRNAKYRLHQDKVPDRYFICKT